MTKEASSGLSAERATTPTPTCLITPKSTLPSAAPSTRSRHGGRTPAHSTSTARTAASMRKEDPTPSSQPPQLVAQAGSSSLAPREAGSLVVATDATVVAATPTATPRKATRLHAWVTTG